VDVQLQPVPAITISGTVMRPEGPVAFVAVRLDLPDSPRGFAADGYATVTDSQGRFTLARVASGDYLLRVTQRAAPAPRGETMTVAQGGSTTIRGAASGIPTSSPNAPMWWVKMPVAAGQRDIRDLQVQLREEIRVSGRVEFDGVADRPSGEQLPRISIGFASADDGSVRMAAVQPDGQFQVRGFVGGRYTLRTTPLDGWSVRSAIFDGRDLADTVVEAGADIAGVAVTFTDRSAGISGVVRRTASADPDAVVLVFPSDPRLWTGATPSRRMRRVRVSTAGAYSVAGLPRGSYYVVAIADEHASGWTEPEVLESLARDAVLVDLDEGARKVLDLQSKRPEHVR
jgi:hypothetical protein